MDLKVGDYCRFKSNWLKSYFPVSYPRRDVFRVTYLRFETVDVIDVSAVFGFTTDITICVSIYSLEPAPDFDPDLYLISRIGT